MLKNYRDFLNEAGLDFDLGGGEEEKKKEEAPDPEEEIEKAKKKRRKEAKKDREEKIEQAEKEIRKALPNTVVEFRNEFEQRIIDALDQDDRVEYHDLILSIQRWQMPYAKENDYETIEQTSPIVKALQSLNKSEYRG